ncbi:MAG TPA: DMT family transporter [Thermoanaerobaculia bacterium]|nr:DMT family transporter [Thermoanaerobaculia bacterium]
MKSDAALPLVAALALIGFASNSILCRMALLEDGTIDPASFTSIRLMAGAATLTLLSAARRKSPMARGNWTSAFALFVYAIAFSLAYVQLTAATGALILFTLVQVTMIGSGIYGGERLRFMQWGGLILALAGLVILCAPGVRAPHPAAAVSMAIAGVSWGVYSLRGRRSSDPLLDTAGNFCRAVPLALLVSAIALRSQEVTVRGALLAIASGALASGVGYSLWYAVVPRIGATVASVLQLLVPVLAALAGVVVIGEPVTTRLAVAGVATIGGVAMVLKKAP